MKLEDLRKEALSGIEPDRSGRSRIMIVGLKGPIKGKRIDFSICDDLVDIDPDLSREERREILTWYDEVYKKEQIYRKKR